MRRNYLRHHDRCHFVYKNRGGKAWLLFQKEGYFRSRLSSKKELSLFSQKEFNYFSSDFASKHDSTVNIKAERIDDEIFKFRDTGDVAFLAAIDNAFNVGEQVINFTGVTIGEDEKRNDQFFAYPLDNSMTMTLSLRMSAYLMSNSWALIHFASFTRAAA